MAWDVTPCSPLKVNWRFGGTSRLRLQNRRISQGRNWVEAGSKKCRWLEWLMNVLSACFDTKDGGDMFLRNIDSLSTYYTALYPIRYIYSCLNMYLCTCFRKNFSHKYIGIRRIAKSLRFEVTVVIKMYTYFVTLSVAQTVENRMVERLINW
jgi:hypothetical protein